MLCFDDQGVEASVTVVQVAFGPIMPFRPRCLLHTLDTNEQETAERRRRQRPAWVATDSAVDDACGFPVVGSGGSRLLSGNSWYAEELEQWIARFHRRPSALLFNSGYDANLGLMSCLPQPGDAVVCDELVHNSVRVSRPMSARRCRICRCELIVGYMCVCLDPHEKSLLARKCEAWLFLC